MATRKNLVNSPIEGRDRFSQFLFFIDILFYRFFQILVHYFVRVVAFPDPFQLALRPVKKPSGNGA